MKAKKAILFLSLLILSAIGTIGAQDTIVEPDQLIVKNTDNFRQEIIQDQEVQFFRGNVRLVQDSAFMFCDSAQIIENEVIAMGDVIIIQNDSITVFSDSLYYNGNSKEAEFYYNVVLQNADKELFTEYLHYNLETKQAEFIDTAILKKGTLTLSSLQGNYNMESKLAYFYNEVVIIDGDMQLSADSILYDFDQDRMYFLCPTYIVQGNRKIYCEDGYYDIGTGDAYFTQNAIIREDDSVAKAISIYYSESDSTVTLAGEASAIDSLTVARGDKIIINDATGDVQILGSGYYKGKDQTIEGEDLRFNKDTEDLYLPGRSRITLNEGWIDSDTTEYFKGPDKGTSVGGVIWEDTIEQRYLYTDILYFKDSTGYFEAVSQNERPMFVQVLDGDSLYVVSDRLRRGELSDSTGYIEAVGNVQILKSDFHGVCDSLYYSEVDSTFSLFRNPICWADTTQILGDTIKIILKDSSIHRLDALMNAFIITKVSPSFYNQISAKNIISYLEEEKLKRMEASGNATSLYMTQDEEDAFVGPNKTLCTEIIFYFKNDSLSHVKFLTQPDSELTPIDQAGKAELFLNGFNWQPERKPISVNLMRKLSISVIGTKSEPKDVFETEVENIINFKPTETDSSEHVKPIDKQEIQKRKN
ncbi:MAG: hypothetical protein HKN09_11850 [Saprospiraceae bacterium]|nr:hypothetical protein [Saprospiraceae bacterium]